MAQKQRPNVGVGVFVTSSDHPGCVLLGIRKGSKGTEKYGLPGGSLEFGEEWEECATRELMEETGLKLESIRLSTIVNAVNKEENFHYIDIMMIGEVDQSYKAEPENPEPDKCEGWVWTKWDKFPPQDQLFCPLQIVKKQEFNPFT